MKKNQPKNHADSKSFAINDYGHDRTVHSLARGSIVARRQKRLKRRVYSVLALLVVLSIGIWQLWVFFPGNSQDNGTSGTTTPQTQGSTDQSAATTSSSAASSSAATEMTTTALSSQAVTISSAERQNLLQAATDRVTSLLKSKPGRFGVYYYNLENDENWQYQADQPFVAASSIKLGINTFLYTQIASEKIPADEILSYDNRNYPTGDYESGTGSIQYEANGTKFTVRETSGLSIRISDNCGTNMIIRRLGGIDAVNPFLKEISGVVDYRQSISYKNYAGQAQSGKHRTCALDLGSHAIKLYRLWQEDPSIYQPLIDDLCQTEFDFGIQKGIPSDVRVAHKIGTNGTYSAENDVGIVFAGEPFVLCVMTEMASAAAAHQVQADVAQTFYDYISGLQG